MEITLTLKDIGLIIIGVSLIVLIFYLICVAKHLTETVKRTNKILADAEVISGIAAGKAEDIDEIISSVSEAAEGLTSAWKGKQGTISALSSAVRGIVSLVGMFNDSDKGIKADTNGKQ